MDKDVIRWRTRWLNWSQVWAHRLDEAGLGGLVVVFDTVVAPFSPLAAQLVLLAQPVFTLFVEPAAAVALADLLDAPHSGDQYNQTDL